MVDLPDRLRHMMTPEGMQSPLGVEAATEIDDLSALVRTQIIQIHDLELLAATLYESLLMVYLGDNRIGRGAQARIVGQALDKYTEHLVKPKL